MTERGRHTVVLGMAPGVGKTFRALEELRRERDAGRDAIVAFVETHGRAATTALIDGLEVLPRRSVAYGGTQFGELDLPALVRRAPALALIDELAHTNVPGVEHEKRWQDVEAALDAGIDVISTVNVQHLESLGDWIAALTGQRVRETVPDRVLVEAHDVVVIDLSPEELVERLRAGLVYPPDRIGAALAGFFRIDHLTALREMALLQTAEDVEARRGAAAAVLPWSPEELMADEPGGPDGRRERVLALLSDRPSAERVLQRAWRSARRLQAPLHALHVRRPGHAPTPEERDRIDELTRVAGLLGADLRIEEDDDVVAVVRRVVRELGITYVIAGVPARGRPARLHRSLASRLFHALPGVDVQFVGELDVPSGERDVPGSPDTPRGYKGR